jgi:hypothetical protein
VDSTASQYGESIWWRINVVEDQYGSESIW